MTVNRTQCVQVGLLVRVVCAEVWIRLFGVFFLVLARFGVLVTEDEVELVVLATLIRSEHDGVRGLIHKLVLDEGGREDRRGALEVLYAVWWQAQTEIEHSAWRALCPLTVEKVACLHSEAPLSSTTWCMECYSTDILHISPSVRSGDKHRTDKFIS